MSEELILNVCANPKCLKEFKEPILLTIQSFTPPKQYQACPYCFTELEETPFKQKKIQEKNIKKEGTMEPTKATLADTNVKMGVKNDDDSDPVNLLKKVKSLIPSDESYKKDKTKESKDSLKFKKEKSSNVCPETFGYLANRPKDVSIPQVCLTCPKMVDCMLSPIEEYTN